MQNFSDSDTSSQSSLPPGDDPKKVSATVENVKNGAASSRARIQFFDELRQLLRDPSLRPALRWQPRHQAMVINPEAFEALVLSRSAAAPKFASFQRRLNRWGFRRVRNIVMYGNLMAYKNPDFTSDEVAEKATSSGIKLLGSPLVSAGNIYVPPMGTPTDSQLTRQLLLARQLSNGAQRPPLLSQQRHLGGTQSLLQQEIAAKIRESRASALEGAVLRREINFRRQLLSAADDSRLRPFGGAKSILPGLSPADKLAARLALAGQRGVAGAPGVSLPPQMRLSAEGSLLGNTTSESSMRAPASEQPRSTKLDSIMQRMELLREEARQELGMM